MKQQTNKMKWSLCSIYVSFNSGDKCSNYKLFSQYIYERVFENDNITHSNIYSCLCQKQIIPMLKNKVYNRFCLISFKNVIANDSSTSLAVVIFLLAIDSWKCQRLQEWMDMQVFHQLYNEWLFSCTFLVTISIIIQNIMHTVFSEWAGNRIISVETPLIS
jgi:hypothetical protein